MSNIFTVYHEPHGFKRKLNSYEVVHGYFYIHYTGDTLDNCGDNDRFLSNLIEISRIKYRKVMKKDFNGFQSKTSGEIYFEKEEDVKKAIEWIESRLIMRKLAEVHR